MRVANEQSSAFTLVELLVAMTVLSLLVLLLASLLGGVNRAWISGEQQVESFQDGRAILELMSRELAPALISPKLQFVQNPTLTGITQRANSGSLFWQAGLASTNNGNVSEVGYYLSENTAQHTFQLNRFFVAPTDAANYQIFANSPNDRNALWVTNFVAVPGLNTLLSDGVVAFWARCLDSNGDPIPWISSAATSNGDTAATPLQFNSAGHFQPAVPGLSGSFKYTSQPSTAQAHLLPATLELTIVTIDSKTMQRSRASVPALPVLTGPQDIPNAITTFNQNLITNNIRAARTFTTRVTLKQSGQ
jgi:prepilin-type N-terminal cleavage/methylation domain-containing protein